MSYFTVPASSLIHCSSGLHRIGASDWYRVIADSGVEQSSMGKKTSTVVKKTIALLGGEVDARWVQHR